jgi:hypothetical protein
MRSRTGGDMHNRISSHVRSNIVGYIALFCFAMGGSAFALDGPLPGQNQVGSEDIINGEVKTADIGTSEVKANNVAPDSLGGNKIVDRSVKNADLGLGASSSNTIADGGIQAIDVHPNTLGGGQIDESTLFNDNSLTGGDIDESTLSGLPSTPSGPAGGDLQGSYPNPQVKPEIVIGTAGLVDVSNCVSFPDEWAVQSIDVNNDVSFTRDPLGIVHLHGVATKCGTPASGDTIFTLPAGSRPAKLEHFGTVAADAFGAIIVDPDGHVTAVAGNFSRGTGGWISLDGLTFRCGPSGVNGCP